MEEPRLSTPVEQPLRGSEPRRRRPQRSLIWGESSIVTSIYRSRAMADIVVIVGILGVFYGITQVSREWTGLLRPAVQIDLSIWALPRYTFFSLVRGLAAYAVSFVFTIVYGYWAAKDRLAERLLVPVLDILQSIPVLGFMPGVVLALVSMFPHSNVGLELAAILMIFTGQAWNMTFSFYNSLKSVPQHLREAGTIYRFSWWHRLTQVEMPFGAISLIWNSMMSMAGGWFFLMVNEAFQLGNRDFRLPGVGSYMSVAIEKGNVPAMVAAVVAMVIMIVGLDQLAWRPVIVWAQKFRIEDTSGEEAPESWFLDLLHHSHVLRWIGAMQAAIGRSIARVIRCAFRRHDRSTPQLRPRSVRRDEARSGAGPAPAAVASRVLFGVLAVTLLVAAVQIVRLLTTVHVAEWLRLLRSDLLTLLRVMVAIVLGTLWAVPAGLRIGLSPRLSRVMQPIVQVAASFPAPMLFPVVITVLSVLHINLGVGSIILMLLGTQWYILFNVIAGAQAIPSDLKEAAASYRITSRQRLWRLYLPAVFPYLVTGWVTATGGAWNASIVAEIVTFRGETLRAQGIGSVINEAAFNARFAELAAAIFIMSATVVLVNRLVWRRLYTVASTRYNLSK